MRITKPLLFLLAAGGIVLLTPPPSQAQTFPTSTWQPIKRAGTAIAATTGGNGYEDIVGSANDTDAAAFVQTDADYMYFRIRINDNPKDPGANQIRPDRVYGCVIDSDGDAPYEFLASYDGIAKKVSLRQNAGAATDSPNDIANALLIANDPGGTYPNGTFGRVVTPASTTFSSNADYYVDIAVPRANLRTAGVPDTKTLRFACGTGQTTGSLNLQLFSPNNGTMSGAWSDPVVCGNSGCSRDQDSDGVIDTLEDSLGTDKTKKDTDGDGIPDNVELSATGSTGPYTGVNTDGDGTIDALDDDSDNDCLSDATEGAGTYRTVASNPSSVCGSATAPVCNSASGTCTACSGPNGSGGNAPCPSTTSPACQTSGACTQCRVGQTTAACTAVAPACNAAGACVKCTGDNGDGAATAACPSAAAPGCVKSGPLAGQCKTCSPDSAALCTSAAAPACDAPSGTCAACNGDRGSGTSRPCPTTGAPVCNIAAGTCGTCAGNGDCAGAGHAGPTCTSGTCVDQDTDGDGLFDSVEINLGTDPTKKDTDGDGINDNIEVTPNGGGQPLKIDTDGDGTIDALDTDSDNDTVLDKDEGVTDTDGDGAPDFRDPDDDGDGIPTSIEVVDGKTANVSDDVDKDGKKNWLDKDSDNNGIEDGVEGRGDEDSDGIPDYLDDFKTPPKPDAGPPDSGNTSSSGGASSSGFTSNDQDAGYTPPPPIPPEEGVVEGTGLFCGRAFGNSASDLTFVVLGALAVMGVARRRRR